MRALATLIVVVLAMLPGLFAGWPGLAPGWFDERLGGIPLSVVAMAGLLALFVALALWSSHAAGRASGPDTGHQGGAE